MKTENVMLLPPDDLFAAVCQMLQEGYDAEFTVTGNSMWPLLAHGRDCVTLRKAEGGSLKKGDIVLLQTQTGYRLHRIARLKNGMLQTTGDHNCYHDELVPAGNVIGRVVCFTRKGKHIACSNLLYRLCSWLWRVLFPVRPFLLRLWSRLRRRTP